MTRYQKGYLFKRGKRRKVWVARWIERVRDNDRSVVSHRSKVLGPVDRLSHRQARRMLDEILQPINQADSLPNGTVTFAEFVAIWKTLVYPTFKPSTQHGYKVVLRKHLAEFDGWRLSDLTKMNVQNFVTRKFAAGLRWQTVRNLWIVLSSVLDSAVEYGYLGVNPAHRVKFPPKPPAAERRILTAKDFRKLLAELNEPLRSMVMLCVLTGLRIGELCALRWRSVDFLARTLKVTESVFQGQFTQPKGNRERVVPLGKLGCRLLRNHRQTRERTAPEDLVFSTSTGRPYREAQIGYRVLSPAAERVGLGRITWHHLRHVHSSVLHDLGTPPKIVQKQLGHARVETTLNIYTHAIAASHRRAVEHLEKKLFPAACSDLAQVRTEQNEVVA
jgi:integrase